MQRVNRHQIFKSFCQGLLSLTKTFEDLMTVNSLHQTPPVFGWSVSRFTVPVHRHRQVVASTTRSVVVFRHLKVAVLTRCARLVRCNALK